jgi:nitrite reductase/ring-hydroxylating ferredoxin subunit
MPSAEIPLAELAENSPKQVEHNGVKLVVIRSGGHVYAYQDRCPHADWPLSEGTVANSVLECPGHAWEFNLQTGRCLNAPDHCLTAVPVVLDGDVVRFQESTGEKGV